MFERCYYHPSSTHGGNPGPLHVAGTREGPLWKTRWAGPVGTVNSFSRSAVIAPLGKDISCGKELRTPLRRDQFALALLGILQSILATVSLCVGVTIIVKNETALR